MALTIHPVPLLSDNYGWLLRDEATGTVAVVDPSEAEGVEAALQPWGGRLDLVLLTHHHADHIGGAEELRQRHGCRIVGARADAYRLPRLDQAVAEGDDVAVGESVARVMETPGHTHGHIAYFFPDTPALFCGDTLFSLGCGRLLEGTAEEMFASLRRIAALPGETRICCGHEYTESNLRFALTVEPHNPALLRRGEAVRALRARGAPTVPALLAEERDANPFLRAPDVARFAALRANKDRFR
jgi:hydroxyacylglutathione hydrolase